MELFSRPQFPMQSEKSLFSNASGLYRVPHGARK